MATFSGTGSINSSYVLDLNVNETSVDTANNTSTVSWSLVLRSTTYYSFADIVSRVVVNINNEEVYVDERYRALNAGQSITIESGTKIIPHNDDGSKTMFCAATYTQSSTASYTPGNIGLSGNLQLTNIDRTPTFTTEPSITNKTETTVTVNRGATDISSNFYWSTNNSTWTKFTATTATITGLSPNTKYTIYIQARNSNNENYKATKQLSVTTYAMPTQTITAKTETAISVSWSISTTASHIWYSIDGGNSWRDLGGISATSGSYTITNLTANTTYNVRTQLLRAENNTNVATASNSITTFNTPSISLVSKTVNSITVRWNIDETANHVWASTDGGSNWTDLGDISATTGEYTASNLEPNSFYYLKIRLRRASTNSLSVTSTLTESTYDIARITGATDIIIGQNATIHYSNPSGATIYSYIEYVMADGNGSVVVSERQVTGNQYTYEFTSNEIQAIYARIPNELYHRYRYVIRTFANNQSYYHIVDRTFYVDRENSKPTFSNFTYEDTDTTYTRPLTNNPQIIVNGFSDITVTISSANKATANNSASISKYRVTIGSVSQEATYSSSADVTSSFTNQTSQVISVTAIDSRGLETTVSKTVTFKDYQRIIVKKATIQREDGIGTKVFFDLKGTYWNGNFGATSNSMENTYYRWKEIGGNFSNFIKVTNSITSSDGTFESVSNAFLPTTDNGTVPQEFELGKRYEIQLIPQDKLYDAYWQPQILTLDSGIPSIDQVYNDDGTYSVGINQLPDEDYALSVNGDVKTNKTFNVEGLANTNGFTQNGHFLMREDYSEGANVISGTGANNNTSGAIIFRPWHTGASVAEARLDNINDESVFRADKVITNDLTVYGEKISDGLKVSVSEPSTKEKVWLTYSKNKLIPDVNSNAISYSNNNEYHFYANLPINWYGYIGTAYLEKDKIYTISSSAPIGYGRLQFGIDGNTADITVISGTMVVLLPNNSKTTFKSNKNQFVTLNYCSDTGNTGSNPAFAVTIQLQVGEEATSHQPYEPNKMYVNDNGIYEEYMPVSQEIYSTTETRIGTWMGKPLYRKVITVGNLSSVSSGSYKAVSTGLSNAIIQDVRCIEYYFSNNIRYTRTVPSTNGIADVILSDNGLYLRIYPKDNAISLNSSVTVILQYTKTTD